MKSSISSSNNDAGMPAQPGGLIQPAKKSLVIEVMPFHEEAAEAFLRNCIRRDTTADFVDSAQERINGELLRAEMYENGGLWMVDVYSRDFATAQELAAFLDLGEDDWKEAEDPARPHTAPEAPTPSAHVLLATVLKELEQEGHGVSFQTQEAIRATLQGGAAPVKERQNGSVPFNSELWEANLDAYTLETRDGRPVSRMRYHRDAANDLYVRGHIEGDRYLTTWTLLGKADPLKAYPHDLFMRPVSAPAPVEPTVDAPLLQKELRKALDAFNKVPEFPVGYSYNRLLIEMLADAAIKFFAPKAGAQQGQDGQLLAALRKIQGLIADHDYANDYERARLVLQINNEATEAIANHKASPVAVDPVAEALEQVHACAVEAGLVHPFVCYQPTTCYTGPTGTTRTGHSIVVNVDPKEGPRGCHDHAADTLEQAVAGICEQIKARKEGASDAA